MSKHLGKKTKTAKNTKKMMIFHKFEHSSLPISIIKKKKKTIGQATSCSTLIISCNCNIRCSLTCLKTCGRRPKRRNALKFVYSSLLTLTTKEIKIH